LATFQSLDADQPCLSSAPATWEWLLMRQT
jgi:hypothetical protein